MHIAAHYSAKVASSLAVVLLTYSIMTSGGNPEATGTYQEPPFNLDDVESRAWLRAAPPPSPQSYNGIGNPFVVVTHHREGGGLDRVLHEAEVWSTDPGGVDLCGSTYFLLRDFRVSYPSGGAGGGDSNVTYFSDAYGEPASATPGNEQCALRAEVGKTWHWRVCIEYDGSFDADSPGSFEAWDRCIEGTATNPAPSSPIGPMSLP